MSNSESPIRREYLETYFSTDLRSGGLPDEFGVVTAYNPNGEPASEAKNVEANLRLKQRLDALGLRYFRVTGMSKDGAHQEPGFGIVTEDTEQIAVLAREFQQEAFFWIENGEIYCQPVRGPAMHRIGSWSERQLKTK